MYIPKGYYFKGDADDGRLVKKDVADAIKPVLKRDALGGNDWGKLPGEPCRYCRKPGGVEFLASDHPLDRYGPQVVRCTSCGAVWDADSSFV